MNTLDVYCRVTNDGYLLWAAVAEEPWFWPDQVDDENRMSWHLLQPETVILRRVPALTAETLASQGTDEQSFADGYEAWGAARNWLP